MLLAGRGRQVRGENQVAPPGASFSNWHEASLWVSGHVLLVAPSGEVTYLAAGFCVTVGAQRGHMTCPKCLSSQGQR